MEARETVAGRRPVAPQLTDEERAAALRKAAEVRHERTVALRAIKAGELAPERFMSEHPTSAKTRVRRFIEAWPGYGKAKARALMDELGISPNRRIRGPGRRQYQALVDRALQLKAKE